MEDTSPNTMIHVRAASRQFDIQMNTINELVDYLSKHEKHHKMQTAIHVLKKIVCNAQLECERNPRRFYNFSSTHKSPPQKTTHRANNNKSGGIRSALHLLGLLTISAIICASITSMFFYAIDKEMERQEYIYMCRINGGDC